MLQADTHNVVLGSEICMAAADVTDKWTGSHIRLALAGAILTPWQPALLSIPCQLVLPNNRGLAGTEGRAVYKTLMDVLKRPPVTEVA
jgi:hypothetical protein